MFQTMQTNGRPQQTGILGAIDSQADSEAGMAALEADLLAELQTASDNVMRLAVQVRTHAGADAAATLAEQHAIAQRLIGRLLAMPVAQA
ncbi:conserved hypothetical protein [Burkholderia sp. 8Y]|uniref:hypothetical protein n=1 Tax=Burkholderia sp. 8Y TaxID=2653133 RepID=UPI0012F31A74|nr:hypothetical protein [Burkholderia sp. 8Y]VXA93624.1 conserved hypothetical protein [Burkholderia sp. 8Y]